MKNGIIFFLSALLICLPLNFASAGEFAEQDLEIEAGLVEQFIYTDDNLIWLENSDAGRKLKVYNLVNNKEYGVSEDGGNPLSAAADGEYLFWLEAGESGVSFYGYDLISHEAKLWQSFSINELSQPYYLSAHGEEVVFSLGTGKTYYFNKEQGTRELTQVNWPVGLQIENKQIVYGRYESNGRYSLNLYSLQNNTSEKLVTGLKPGFQFKLNENNLIWRADDEIKIYDLSSRRAETLPAEFFSGADARDLEVFGDYVAVTVWDEELSMYKIKIYDREKNQIMSHDKSNALFLSGHQNNIYFVSARKKQAYFKNIDLTDKIEAPELLPQGLNQGDLIKGQDSTVYYIASDFRKYAFPNEKCFFSWYPDFTSIKTVQENQLAEIEDGGFVTYRPGERLITSPEDNKVYAVLRGGRLAHIATEELATELFGADWRRLVDDLSMSFWNNYRIIEPINSLDDYEKLMTNGQWDLDQSVSAD